MVEALVFDLDSTRADTEETHRQAFNAAVIELGLWWDWGPPLYTRLLAVSGGKERLRHYIGTLRVAPAERERLLQLVPGIHATKTRIYTELLVRGQRPFRPGVLALLRTARAGGPGAREVPDRAVAKALSWSIAQPPWKGQRGRVLE